MTRHTWTLAPNPAGAAAVPALDAQQQAAVAWARGPALVLGGPGTGKTTVLVEAALARVQEGSAPSSVLVLTSDREAVARLREGLTLRSAGAEPPRVSTFHGLALDLVRRAGDVPPLLLSGAEQERAVRDVIDGTLTEPHLIGIWPPDLREAVPTRGFAREVRNLFAAARALGLAGDEVARFARQAQEPAWVAVAPLLDAYLEAQDQQGALDYAELMFRALAVATDPGQHALLAGVQHVLVDEFHDTDGMQSALLAAVTAHAVSLLACADPDQSVFGFRGSDLTQVRHFSERFLPMAVAHGQDEVGLLALQHGYRCSAGMHGLAAGLFGGTVPSGVPLPWVPLHRQPRTDGHAGVVEVLLYDDASAEAAVTAARIRDLGQAGSAPWDEIAVMARTTQALRGVERALERLGVPTVADVRDGRLVDEPAVRTLVRALEAVAGAAVRLSPHDAHELLLSPLCGLDPTEVRGIARALRGTQLEASDALLAAALAAPTPAFDLPDHLPGAAAFEHLRALLQRAHAQVRAGDSPHEVLWQLWDGSAWPAQLRRRALEQASESAHRQLDAVCDLFDIADRAVQRRQGHAGVSAFVYELLAQDVPAHTLARRGYRGPAVSLLTAHRAKGQQWQHVFVLGVDDAVWPGMRRRATIYDTNRMASDGLIAPRSRQQQIDEERRLLYLACTRASHTLVLSSSVGTDDAQPSRFLPEARRVIGRPRALEAPSDLVAELRRTLTASTSTAELRASAAQRLAHLATLRDDDGRALFPEANPDTWWGTRATTQHEQPMTPPDDPLYIRGSSLESLEACSLQWFLQQRAGAEAQRSTSLVFGSAIHALADGVVKGALPPDVEVLTEHLRSAWHAAGYEAAWQSERDFEEGMRAIARFVRWHSARKPDAVASEVAFDRVVTLRTPTGRLEALRMRGTIDRVEVAGDGTVMVFDYKTGRSKPSAARLEAHAQLRFYQLAVAQGLLDDALADGRAHEPSGAALVHLRLDADSRSSTPAVQEQAALRAEQDPWVVDVLGAALDTVRAEAFSATPGSHCAMCRMTSVCPVQPEGRVETA